MMEATMIMLQKFCISRDIVVEVVSVSDARFAIRPITVLSAVAMTIPLATPADKTNVQLTTYDLMVYMHVGL